MVTLTHTNIVQEKRKKKQKKNKKKKNQRKNQQKGYNDGIPNIITVKANTRKPRNNMNADVRQFQLALRNPFDARAIGARVVDSYMTPTVTYHIRGTVSVTPNSSGECQMAMLPSPVNTLVAPSSGNGGPGTLTTSLGDFTQNTQGSTVAGGKYCFSPQSLADKLTEYRVVSWGIRLLAKDTAYNTKGKIFIAMVPTTDNAPSWAVLNNVTGTAASLGEYLIGMSLADINKIPNLPGVRCFSMQELLRGEVMVVGTPTHSSYYAFKGTTDNNLTPWNTGQYLMDEGVFNSSTGVMVNATAQGRRDPASLRGGRAIIIWASGLPTSGNAFDIEFIYHMEGTPNLASSNNYLQLVPSSMRSVTGSSALIEKCIGIASAASTLFQFVKDPLNAAAGTRAVKFLT